MVINDILGLNVDLNDIENSVMKVKKQINLECNTLPLIDEDLGKE